MSTSQSQTEQSQAEPATKLKGAEVRRVFLSKQLRAARDAVHLSREQMVSLLSETHGEVSISTVRRWEDPEAPNLPNADLLWAWADLTGRPVRSFFEPSGAGGQDFDLVKIHSGTVILTVHQPGRTTWQTGRLDVVFDDPVPQLPL